MGFLKNAFFKSNCMLFALYIFLVWIVLRKYICYLATGFMKYIVL